MDIYIVVYKTNEYNPEVRHRTYEYENDALLQAIEYGSNSEYKFDKVLKLNTTSKRIAEYELGIVSGQIKLKERGEVNK